jgi:transposase-like protein
MSRASAGGMQHHGGVPMEAGKSGYRAAFKARVVKRSLGPQAVSVSQLAKAAGVRQPSLSKWVRELRSVPGMPRCPREERTGADKLRVVQGAAGLEDPALGRCSAESGRGSPT